MGITLKELGITNEELIDRAVDAIAEQALQQHVVGFEKGGDPEQDSRLGVKLRQACLDRLDEAVRAETEKHVLPFVTENIATLVIQQTNQWGEAKGKEMTFMEFVVEMAKGFMGEEVDRNGNAKKEDSYHWSGCGQTRLVHAVNQYLHKYIENAMKQVLGDGMKILKDGVEETAKRKLAEIASSLKVQVETK